MTNEEQARTIIAALTASQRNAELARAERRGLQRAADLLNKRADQYAAQGNWAHWDIRALAREVAEMTAPDA